MTMPTTLQEQPLNRDTRRVTDALENKRGDELTPIQQRIAEFKALFPNLQIQAEAAAQHVKRGAPAVTRYGLRLCACGCGQALSNHRRDAKYYDATCRKRASRADANARRDADRMIATIRKWQREGRADLLAELAQTLLGEGNNS